jgi:hypothetical protein
MLFDIRGRRKRVIQVIYVGLAVLMGGGLIFFGIGGGTNGGLFDAIGIGGDGGSSDPQFDNRIERAEEDLAANPKDEKALLALAETHYLKAQTALEVDDQGRQTITDEAKSEYADAIDAWETYLDTKPKDPDDSTAALILNAYLFTTTTDDLPSDFEDKVQGAYEAAKVVADAQPSFGTYLQLTQAALYAGEDEVAKQAEKKTYAKAADEASKSAAKGQIAQAKQQAVLIKQFVKGGSATAAEGPNPLQDLGGGVDLGTTDPATGTPTTPAPPPEPTGGDAAGGEKKK